MIETLVLRPSTFHKENITEAVINIVKQYVSNNLT